MDNIENEVQNESLKVTDSVKTYINETAKWAKFFSILGFIGVGICLLAGVFSSAIISLVDIGSRGFNPLAQLGATFLMFFYFIIALIYFFPAKYLFDFSNKVKVALQFNDQNQFELAFAKLKSCFKYIGVWSIVIISLYIIILFVTVFGTIATAFI